MEAKSPLLMLLVNPVVDSARALSAGGTRRPHAVPQKEREVDEETRPTHCTPSCQIVLNRKGDERERRSPLPEIIRSSYPHLG